MPRFSFSRWRLAGLVLAASLLAAGCANPVPPGGGPRDEEPPGIAASRPEAEATNISGRTVGIQFSEYVERSTLRQALSVTPQPEAPLEFSWDQRSVEITFPRPFRDSTTYLLTIDKTLQDVRGVALEQPITLAFSTGDQIDRGRLAGRVIGAARGEGREGFDVYAYSADAADSTGLPARGPLYRTQTGPEGDFAFAYLREEARYYVVALRDQNRNRRPDPLEAFAAPPRPSLPARAGSTAAGSAATPAPPDSINAAAPEDRAPWVAGAQDPVPPRLTRAIPASRRRVALRFNEPIRLQSRAPGRFALTDTTTGQRVAVESVYRRPGQPQRLTLRTAAAMQSAGHRARLLPGDVPVLTDTSGNAPERPAEAAFTASGEADTLGLRFRGFAREGAQLPVSAEGNALVLAPGQAPAVQFNRPPRGNTPAGDSAAARRLVSARDTSSGDAMVRATRLPFRLTTDDGTTYRVRFTPPLDSGQVARLRVDGRRLRPPADTVYTRLVRRLSNEALGAVSGVVRITRDTLATDTTELGRPFVELYSAEGSAGEPLRTTRADSSGQFLFENLPEAAYRFRAFLDRDEDTEWDAGRLAPYRPAEPLTWSRQPVQARPRWETAAADTLRLDDLRPLPAD